VRWRGKEFSQATTKGERRIDESVPYRRLRRGRRAADGRRGGVRRAPTPTATTLDLLAKAKNEGKIVWYTSIELQTAEKIAKTFESAHLGVDVQVERNGCERIVQRIGQERSSNIHAADVVECSDMTALLNWKKQGWLAPYVPVDVAKYPAEYRDPDGFYATDRLTLSPIEYKTKLVKPEEAPKSFADLLDPKWKGKIVKAHPGYSGTIMTVTYEIGRDLGWDYLKRLGQQQVMQVQSAADPPKKVAQGERPVAADGGEYLPLQMIEKGAPLALVYPAEGTPTIPGGAGVMGDAPHPNAARVFANYLFSKDGQQLLVDMAKMRSAHPDVKLPADMKPLAEIKTMQPDTAAQEKETAEIKKKYAEYFGL